MTDTTQCSSHRTCSLPAFHLDLSLSNNDDNIWRTSIPSELSPVDVCMADGRTEGNSVWRHLTGRHGEQNFSMTMESWRWFPRWMNTPCAQGAPSLRAEPVCMALATVHEGWRGPGSTGERQTLGTELGAPRLPPNRSVTSPEVGGGSAV